MRSYRQSRAFTLIELIVIIFIIAVMSAVVVPAYSRYWSRAKFEGKVREVQDVFAYAREQAISGDETVTVQIDPGSQSIAVMVALPTPPADLPVALSTTNNANVSNTPQPVTRGVQLRPDYALTSFSSGTNGQASSTSNGMPAVHFYGDGTSDGAQFTLVSATGHGAQVVIWPATGRLTLEQMQ